MSDDFTSCIATDVVEVTVNAPMVDPGIDAVAPAVAQQMSVHQMQVDLPALRGMSGRAVSLLAKKVAAGGRVPGRHGVHRNHARKVHAHHVNFLLQRMRETGAQVTLKWMCDQLNMYFGIDITVPGLSEALASVLSTSTAKERLQFAPP